MIANIEEFVDLIRSGKQGRDKAIRLLYHDEDLRRNMSQMISSFNWDMSIKDEILGVAIMKFILIVIKNKEWRIKSDLNHYIVTIGKNEWLRRLKLDKKHLSEDIEEVYDVGDSDKLLFLENEKYEILKNVLSRLGESCKEVLLMWANAYTYEEIAQKLNYKSLGMARKKKYKCLKALSEIINENPKILELLRNNE